MSFFRRRKEQSSATVSLLHPNSYSSKNKGLYLRQANLSDDNTPLSPCSASTQSPSSPLSISSYTYPYARPQRSSTVSYAHSPTTSVMSTSTSLSPIDDDNDEESGEKAKKPTAWDRAANRIHRKTALEEAEKQRQSEEQQTYLYQQEMAAQQERQGTGEIGKKAKTMSIATSLSGARHNGGWFGGRFENGQKIQIPTVAAYDYDAWLREI